MKYVSCFVWMVMSLSVIMFGCSSSKGLKKEEKLAREAALREAIENRSFVVEVDKALPMGGSSRMLTSPYSLTIKGDTVRSYLPYFGRAYSVPYGGGEGLIFNSTITDYKSSFEKNDKSIIEFKTRSKEDHLTYRVIIFMNGSASIDVISGNRQPISFNGKAYPPKE